MVAQEDARHALGAVQVLQLHAAQRGAEGARERAAATGTVDEELARLGEVEEEARVEEGQAVQAQHQLVGVGGGAV